MWGWLLAMLLVSAALFAAVMNPEAASKMLWPRREDDGASLLSSRVTPLDAVVVPQYSACAPLEDRVPHAAATATPGVRARMAPQLLGYL